jgi:hypothetical protein
MIGTVASVSTALGIDHAVGVKLMFASNDIKHHRR